MHRLLDGWRKLQPWERVTLLKLAVLLPFVGAALRLLGFNRTRRLLAKFSGPLPDPTINPNESELRQANRMAELVSIAAHYGPYRASCLPRAMALWWLFSRRGIASELQIGVYKDDGDFEAHAWVECNGLTFNETIDIRQRFSVLWPG